MAHQGYPQPPSHKTFTFGSVIIDSNFDSGNCSNAEKVSNTSYSVWIGTDHPKNNYKTWFYFSVKGIQTTNTITFNIKNMQNQSKMLYQGLVPVYRRENDDQWKRIPQKVDLSSIEYNQGWIEWNFTHKFKSPEKVYFAFFYPWSNDDNSKFLQEMEKKAKQDSSIYWYRTPIIRSLEGRPVQFVVITSNTFKYNKEEKIQDEHLFKGTKKPCIFGSEKKGVVIGARVHPGQVPGSHVMTGIIKQLVSDSEEAKILRDNFVFYLFPIFNPDGVGRGHYRVDTNGINLNRCYLTPSAKYHPSIYAVKKIILHLHEQEKFFAFLDLHAHATRRGTFIYGNWTNSLIKQMETCIFPKILSMNCENFEYEGSNFTEKNMYCKDKADHMSKEGSGRVAIFKATNNPYCWTLECNYNKGKVINVLEKKKNLEDEVIKPTENDLDSKIIIDYKYPTQKQPRQFYSIESYHELGRQICHSFLDLIEKNPYSRIQNPNNHFKSVQNLKMHLAVALLRMAPTRFEPQYKKIYNFMTSENKEQISRAMQALFYLMIKNAKIENVLTFMKEGDMKQVIFPVKVVKKEEKKSKSIRFKKKISFKDMQKSQQQKLETIQFPKEQVNYNSYGSDFDDQLDDFGYTGPKVSSILFDKLGEKDLRKKSTNKVSIHFEEIKVAGFNNLRKSIFIDKYKKLQRQGKVQELPNLFSRREIESLPRPTNSKVLIRQ